MRYIFILFAIAYIGFDDGLYKQKLKIKIAKNNKKKKAEQKSIKKNPKMVAIK